MEIFMSCKTTALVVFIKTRGRQYCLFSSKNDHVAPTLHCIVPAFKHSNAGSRFRFAMLSTTATDLHPVVNVSRSGVGQAISSSTPSFVTQSIISLSPRRSLRFSARLVVREIGRSFSLRARAPGEWRVKAPSPPLFVRLLPGVATVYLNW